MAALQRWGIAACACVVFLLAVLCYRLSLAIPAEVTLRDDRGVHPVVLPYSDAHASTTAPMVFSFHLRKGLLTPTLFRMVPDDHLLSISVNGRPLPLADVDPHQLDDYSRGFAYPLGHYLTRGDNEIAVGVLNRGGGPGGLDVHAEPNGGNRPALVCAACAAIALLSGAMRAAGCRWSSVSLAAAGLGLRLGYLWVTPLTLRAHDAIEHLDYVHYLLDHHSIPKAADGWAFYHPPVYYFVSALLYAGFGAIGLPDYDLTVILQLESVVFELGFVAFAVAAVRLWLGRLHAPYMGRRLLGRDHLAFLCAAFIVFWPTSVMHSVRMGNDDMAYLCFGGVLYFGSRWWMRGREGSRRDFYVAAAIAALGVVTKSHCAILFVVLGVALLVRFFRERELRSPKFLAYAAPLVLLCVASLALDLHEALRAVIAHKQDYLFVGNEHRTNPALTLTNRPRYFLGFDFPTFLTRPFTSPWDDVKGRQWFWNYLLKTSLFGEWDFGGGWVALLGTLMSWSCLVMIPVVAAGALLRKGREVVDELPLSVMALLLIGGLLGQRLSQPVFHGDFRYAIPATTQFSYWYVCALAVGAGRRWVRAAQAGVLLGWAFVGLSVTFIGTVMLSAA